MHLQLSPRDEAFRNEVLAFLEKELTPGLRREGRLCRGVYCERPVAQAWLARLNARGWAAPNWPAEHGGAGWTAVQHYIFLREAALADAPPVTPNAVGMVGPAIIAFGTDAQKAQYLPRIRSGEDWWAQGYSEPNAGSDLAALQCRAERRGDRYVINGSKIWTTHAHFSNKIFCLVRTRQEGKPQAGISFLLFDMDLPGISVRPIPSISGDHELNQIFFDDVEIPVSGRLGEEHDGWTVAKYLLGHERGHQYSPRIHARLKWLKRTIESAGLHAFARAVAEAEIRTEALEFMELRVFSAQSMGREIGALASMLKVVGTELRQHVSEIGQDVTAELFSDADDAEMLPASVLTAQYFNDRAASIYAGSNEIQRNILAKAKLGL